VKSANYALSLRDESEWSSKRCALGDTRSTEAASGQTVPTGTLHLVLCNDNFTYPWSNFRTLRYKTRSWKQG
jgi:hypothetical protein